jgi:serine/threonine protein kinase
VDARADVYALGCLLFKLLTGEVPFPRDGEAARLYAHLNDEPPAASLFTPMVPKALDRVIARAMAKDPDDRYPSAGDLGRAAAAALSGEEVEVSEQMVATGAAATRVSATPPEPSTEPEEVSGTKMAEDKTPARTTPPASRPERRRPSRRPMLAIGAIALVAMIAGAIALFSGGGDGGGSSSAKETQSDVPEQSQGASSGQGTPQGGGGAQGGEGETKPKPLKKEQFISKADAHCVRTQEDFQNDNAQFQSGQLDDLGFARNRFENSGGHLRRLRKLERRAPISVRATFRRYVAAIERVHEYDREALAAARKGDLAGIDAANAKNLGEQGQRYELARQIGFVECSKNPA